MRTVHHRSSQSKLYRLLYQFNIEVKLIVYALVMLINLNILFSPPQLMRPLSVLLTFYLKVDASNPIFGFLVANKKGLRALGPESAASLGLTFLLVVLTLFGYALIVYLYAPAEVAALIRSLDAEAESRITENRFSLGLIVPAFSPLVATVLLGCGAILMQALYANVSAGFLIAVFAAQAPVSLHCLRRWVGSPRSLNERTFVIVYDTLVSTSVVRNHLLLATTLFFGLVRVEWFTIQVGVLP